MSDQRYEGKPLLRILECYVLWSIGRLQEKDMGTLQKLTPKLQELYGVDRDWRGIVEVVMDLPQDMPALIRDVWTKNLSKHGADIDPEAFAREFVDVNLASSSQ